MAPPVRVAGANSGGLFGPGQPLDHEPNMGQVPLISPGSPSSGNNNNGNINNAAGNNLLNENPWMLGLSSNQQLHLQQQHHFGRLAPLPPLQPSNNTNNGNNISNNSNNNGGMRFLGAGCPSPNNVSILLQGPPPPPPSGSLNLESSVPGDFASGLVDGDAFSTFRQHHHQQQQQQQHDLQSNSQQSHVETY
ncbi:hypothetical protein HELRODRAFT_166325 [Helobdella robusta]|uniref:Uncharacterized protein n=1 Tax=Helobdella robusta TaxID=6412 RepID=T1EY08_HELRO|nr:hypothetical protein HELRODRAFT_166325 [Helobdella robusta]ESN90628.1 hypothetical protein HELRODRAFT_166325 [Helobdella robusta]